jgi:hypothetical protein
VNYRNYEKMIQEAILDVSFENGLKLNVLMANNNLVGASAPWEVVMAYLIALERRVADLERAKRERQ